MKEIKIEEIGILAIYVDGEFTHLVKANGQTALFTVKKANMEDYKDLLDSKNGIIRAEDNKDEEDD